MAISPSGKGELDSSDSSDVMVRVVGGVIGAIVLFFIARWIIGFVFTLVKFGIFLAVVFAVIYIARQVTRKA
jgi:hypothetical protein